MMYEPIFLSGTLLKNIKSMSLTVRPFSSGMYRKQATVASADMPPKMKPTLPFRFYNIPLVFAQLPWYQQVSNVT